MTRTKWEIDPSHSEIQFKIRHLMITNVTGQFNRFEGKVETDGEDFTTGKVHFSADVDSISTNNPQRDAHLQNSDFFDAGEHPRLEFESDKIEKTDEDSFKVYGTLTMRGVSKKIVLDADYSGSIQDPWGNTRAGVTINGKLNRKDYGVSFGLLSETGGVALGDEVKISANMQFVKHGELQPA